MNNGENPEVVAEETDNTAEVSNENEADFVKVSKSDYEKMNQTLGSLKRENKDLKKSKEPVETDSKPDNAHLEKLERLSMRIAGIDHPEDMELARKTAKKWNVDIDEVLADEDFKAKLGKQQSVRANTLATSGVRGGAGASGAKFTPEYWIAKGVPPTASDVPDRKARVIIARAMMASTKSGKKFHND